MTRYLFATAVIAGFLFLAYTGYNKANETKSPQHRYDRMAKDYSGDYSTGHSYYTNKKDMNR